MCAFQGVPREQAEAAIEGSTTTGLLSDSSNVAPSSSNAVRLPGPESLTELDQHLRELLSTGSALQRRRAASQIIEEHFVSSLCRIYRELTPSTDEVLLETGSVATRELLQSVVKNIVLVNNVGVLKELLSDEHFLDTFGILEHPGVSFCSAALSAPFKSVLPMQADLLSLIHATFRIALFKDTVAASFLDDDVWSSLQLLLRSSHVAILERIDATDIYEQLLSIAGNTYALEFLRELLGIAQSVVGARTMPLQLYRSEHLCFFLSAINTDNPLPPLPADDDGQTNQGTYHYLSAQLITHYAQHDVSIVRKWLVHDPPQLAMLIDRFTGTSSALLRSQLACLLRTICTLPSLPGATQDRSADAFLQLLYSEHATRLLTPLIVLDGRVRSLRCFYLHPTEVDLFLHLTDLLCLFISSHRYRIKYLLLRSFLMPNTLLLLRCYSPLLRLSAIRVFRAMIGTGDDFYFRFMIKSGSLKTILDSFLIEHAGDEHPADKHEENGGGTSPCIGSAIADLIESIRVHRLRTLIDHIVDAYGRHFLSLPSATERKLETGKTKMRHHLWTGLLDVWHTWHASASSLTAITTGVEENAAMPGAEGALARREEEIQREDAIYFADDDIVIDATEEKEPMDAIIIESDESSTNTLNPTKTSITGETDDNDVDLFAASLIKRRPITFGTSLLSPKPPKQQPPSTPPAGIGEHVNNTGPTNNQDQLSTASKKARSE